MCCGGVNVINLGAVLDEAPRGKQVRVLVTIVCAFLFLGMGQASGQTYEYDQRGRLERVVYADCSVIRYFYDAAGNRTERIVLVGNNPCSENNPPIAVDDSISLSLNEAAIFNLLQPNGATADTDPDGDEIRIASVSQGTVPLLSASEAAVILQSDRQSVSVKAPDYEGLFEFSYTIEDSYGLSSSAQVFLEVVDGASGGGSSGDEFCPPEITSDRVASVKRNDLTSFYSLEAIAVDSSNYPHCGASLLSGATLLQVSQGDEIRYSISQEYEGVEYFHIDENSGELRIIEGIPENEVMDFEILEVPLVAEDGNGGRASVVLSVMVLPIVDEDTIGIIYDYRTVQTETNVTFDVTYNDYDALGLGLTLTSVRLLSGSGNAQIRASDNTIRVNAPSSSGEMVMRYCVRNAYNFEDCGFFTVTVVSEDELPPIARDDGFTLYVGSGEQSLDVLDNDYSYTGFDLRVSSIDAASVLNAIIPSGGQSVMIQAPNEPGNYSFTYEVADSRGLVDEALVSLYVKTVSPEVVNDYYEMRPGRSRIFSPLDNDNSPRGESLEITNVELKDGSCLQYYTDLVWCDPHDYVNSLWVSDGDVYVSLKNDEHLIEFQIEYTITDGFEVDQGYMRIGVSLDYNEPPSPQPDAYFMASNSQLQLLPLENDEDVNGDRVSLVTQQIQTPCGSMGVDYVFHSSVGPCETSFSYQVMDGRGRMSESTITVSVASPDLMPPKARRDSGSIPVNQWVAVDVLSNDIDVNETGLELVLFEYHSTYCYDYGGCPDHQVYTRLVNGSPEIKIVSPNATISATIMYQIEDGLGLRSSSYAEYSPYF